MISSHDNSILAWSGWRMRIPAHWRPLRIAGGWDNGQIMLGDSGRAMLQVKWLRPGSRRFSGTKWLEGKLRKAGSPATSAPKAPAFSSSALVTQNGEPKRGERALWYGYDPESNLAMELTANLADSPQHRRRLTGQIVPSMKTETPRTATHWSVFGSSFKAPAGFYYARCNLKLGDLSLEFIDTRRRRLVLRQIYPAGLALSRRELQMWMADYPFASRRRNITLDCDDYEHDRGQGKLRRGTRRIAWPLGFIRPLWTLAVAVIDQDTDRILLAEIAARDCDDLDLDLIEQALADMNWAGRQEAA
jgi:hypothetical protein